MSAAGSDSKQRKLNFYPVSSFLKNQHENVSDISKTPRVIEKSSNNSYEIQLEVIPEISTQSFNIMYPSSSLSVNVLSDQEDSNVIINDNDIFSSEKSLKKLCR